MTSMDVVIGQTGDGLQQPDNILREVKNLVRTENGGLRSSVEPIPFLYTAAGAAPTNSSTPNTTGPVYDTTKGIFHAVVGGKRDVLLLHTGVEVWAFHGWARAWSKVIAASGGLLEAILPDLDLVEFPTQFISTPTGVVIVPQGARAYVYDGITCLPLGYDHAPGAPIGLGPESTSSRWFPSTAIPWTGVNDAGYTMDGLSANLVAPAAAATDYGHPPSGMLGSFRYGRLGTISTPGNISTLADSPADKSQVMGYLEPGRYRAKVQWIDRWGNLSPASAESGDIKFQRQPSMVPYLATAPATYGVAWVQAECVRKQVGWDGIIPGPTGTIARVLGRTKDLENSGDASFYEVPLDASVHASALATLPDNVSDFYPDNIPDAWLTRTITEVDPVPQFKLCAVAFGRLWVANWPGSEGAVRASMPGRWGTFGKADPFVWPDPTGGEVTGLHAVAQGLLIFTETGAYLLEDPAGRPRAISSTSGCAAPSSIRTMRNGVTVWLARDGFYGFAGGEVRYLFEQHREDAKKHNKGRLRAACAEFDPKTGRYMCWVGFEGAQYNTRCWTYDGTDWHHEDVLRASSVTVTKDHRSLILACGTSTYHSDKDGVWVLNGPGDPVSSLVKTGWIRGQRTRDRASTRRVYFTLRETRVPAGDAQKVQVSIRRDYRAEVVDSTTLNTYPEVSSKVTASNSAPTLSKWGTGAYNDGGSWRKRRIFRAKADIDVAGCEVFQIEATCTKGWEILSIAFEEQEKPDSGSRAFK
jgi:hypothetical protein